MTIKTYHDIEVENGRPVPSDRPDDYNDSGMWNVVWGKSVIGKGSFYVYRRGDDHPTEEYHFRARFETDGDGSSGPRHVKATPVTRKTERLQKHASGYKVNMSRGGYKPKTREESISLDELPDVIRRYVEDNEHIQLVESVYPTEVSD